LFFAVFSDEAGACVAGACCSPAGVEGGAGACDEGGGVVAGAADSGGFWDEGACD